MKEIVNDGFAKVVKPYMDAQDKKSREIIAPVEVSPAEAAHSAGEQIIFNGILYDVIAPIAAGDALSTSGAGANISAADNIEAQIKATKSQIQTAAAQAAAQNKNTQEMIAPVEEDETDASRAYEVGEQLILEGVLYNVIDAIAQHGIITSEGAGANIEEADNVTDQLSSLNGALSNLDGKAYKTDDAAITEVASDDLLPIYDSSAAAKKKIAVNNFIGGLVSNPNLLDNPWFTVNQRGASSYNRTGYTLDRWRLSNNTGAVTIDNNGIILSDGEYFQQQFPDEVYQLLKGKTVTLSILMANGNTYSRTGMIPATLPASGTVNCLGIIIEIPNMRATSLYLNTTTMYVQLGVNPNSSVSIRAVKLELGSVSTLAMDTAPNYATELLKCQRYCIILGSSSSWDLMGIGVAGSASSIDFNIPYSDMRDTPTISMPDGAAMGWTSGSYSSANIFTDLNVLTGTGKNRHPIGLRGTTTGLTQGSAYRIIQKADTKVILSADL